MMKGAQAYRVAVDRFRSRLRFRHCATPGSGTRLRLSLPQPQPRDSVVRRTVPSDGRSGGRCLYA